MRAYRPTLEMLDQRVLATVTPTDWERNLLDLLNAARADPPAYGRTLGVDLAAVAPAPPLFVDARLTQVARGHSQDMNDRRFFGHTNPNGHGPGQRLAAAGINTATWAESIAAGYPTPDEALAALIVDAGVPSLGHRRHLLGIDPVARAHTHVGVGIADATGPYRWYYTIDTAQVANPAPLTVDVGWVTALYRDLLGRRPASAEVAQWRGWPEPLLVTALLGSAEHRAVQVAGWYRDYLGRQPDPPGLQGWVAALAAGVAEDQVRVAIMGSVEAFTVATTFVPTLYRHLLGREAADWEVVAWLPAAHANRASAALAILQSHEARAHQVQRLYAGLLGRAADPGGLTHFAGLLAGGLPQMAVVAALVQSDEYRRRPGR